jgi:hypothetical protein
LFQISRAHHEKASRYRRGTPFTLFCRGGSSSFRYSHLLWWYRPPLWASHRFWRGIRLQRVDGCTPDFAFRHHPHGSERRPLDPSYRNRSRPLYRRFPGSVTCGCQRIGLSVHPSQRNSDSYANGSRRDLNDAARRSAHPACSHFVLPDTGRRHAPVSSIRDQYGYGSSAVPTSPWRLRPLIIGRRTKNGDRHCFCRPLRRADSRHKCDGTRSRRGWCSSPA